MCIGVLCLECVVVCVYWCAVFGVCSGVSVCVYWCAVFGVCSGVCVCRYQNPDHIFHIKLSTERELKH